MTAWADEEDVVQVTGQSATPESLALAQSMIEDKADTDTSASDAELISSRNLSRLRKAVCYQAVWLDAHPDVLQVMAVQGVSQDGLSAQYADIDAAYYSPLALNLLRKLSWKSAPLRVARRKASASDQGNRDSAVRDDQYVWTPL